MMFLLFTLLAAVASAQRCAMVAVVMDESGSMAGEQAWISSGTLQQIFVGLEAAGLDTANMACVVGYEGTNPATANRFLGCDFFPASAAYSSLFSPFQTSGATEDGLVALEFAVDKADDFIAANAGAIAAKGCSEVIRMAVLITDEDRDVIDNAVTDASIRALLASQGWIVNVILDAAFGFGVIGVESDSAFTGTQIVATSGGGFATGATGVSLAGLNVVGKAEYADLAWDFNGVAWDLNILRAGGNGALSFTNAFIDKKVEEIMQAPPPPPPAPVTTPAPTFTTPAPTAS